MLKAQIKKIAEKVDVRLDKDELEDVNLYMGTELQMLQSDLALPEVEERVANIILGIGYKKEL